MICKQFDVVVVPFPFADSSKSKMRPALVLSDEKFNKQSSHSVMAMITSAKHSSWPLDILIVDVVASGLSVSSMIRMKLFTIDNRIIVKKIGQLSAKDQALARKKIKELLGQ